MNKLKSFFLILPLLAGLTACAGKANEVAPDNTQKNVRDANDKSQTAQDQSNEKDDIDLTQRIRQAVMDDTALSTNAKNIKIITSKRVVTLRGPVGSQDEKNNIYEKARIIAGASKVVNELEVTPQ